MPGKSFQQTVGASAVKAADIAALSGAAVRSGIKLTLPSGNSGSVFYGFTSGVLTTTGCLIPNGIPFTINPAEFDSDLNQLFFIASAGGQTITGVAL